MRQVLLLGIALFSSSLQAAESPIRLQVPITRQSTEYSCGAAALQSVMTYWKKFDDTESTLMAELGTTEKDGTAFQNLPKVARKYKLKAKLQEHLSVKELARQLDRGVTAILDIQAWPESGKPPANWRTEWESGHYVVLVGLDEERAYFMDPSTAQAYTYIPLAELEARWHDYDIVGGHKRIYEHAAVLIEGDDWMPGFPGDPRPLQ